MSLYARVADLPLEIVGQELEPLQQPTKQGWTRHTTVIRLLGPDGLVGRGEDVTYMDDEQVAFRAHGTKLPVTGAYSVDGFSRHLDQLVLFPRRPAIAAANCYRR